MLQALIGPIASLAGTWLTGRTETKAAETRVKVARADAEAQIMVSAATSTADWERIMAQGSQSSFRDEWFSGVLSIPLILCFIPGMEDVVAHGFEQLSKAPEWYFYCLGTAILSSFGVKAGGRFFKK
jgi:hypothetical protein